MTYSFAQTEPEGRAIGLVVLQSDETVEADMRRRVVPRHRPAAAWLACSRSERPRSRRRQRTHLALT